MIQQEVQTQSSQSSRPKDPFSLQFMIFYIFFMQGIIASLGSSMPFVYEKLPSYSQMSLFFASIFPQCFKFIVAPFLEKYTNMNYGKRKTWLILSELVAGGLLILASRFTAYQQIDIFAWILILINFALIFQNMAASNLAIKHFQNRQRIGVLKIVGGFGGGAIGGLTILQLTNTDFAQALGLESAITSPSTIIIGYSILLLSSIPPIHFWFRERRLKSEDVSQAKGI